jgi:hypothetical protein
MWWYERQERARGITALHQATGQAERGVELNAHLIDVIRANTEALVGLREELRAHRQTESARFDRLSRQLENLERV